MEKKPFLTESMAQDIIQDVPTPFHVYDEKGIRENAKALKEAFSWNRGYKEYFAVKATPNPFLLNILLVAYLPLVVLASGLFFYKKCSNGFRCVPTPFKSRLSSDTMVLTQRG